MLFFVSFLYFCDCYRRQRNQSGVALRFPPRSKAADAVNERNRSRGPPGEAARGFPDLDRNPTLDLLIPRRTGVFTAGQERYVTIRCLVAATASLPFSTPVLLYFSSDRNFRNM